jgi:hypothetical protein
LSEATAPVGCSVYDVCVIEFPSANLTFELVYRPLAFYIVLRSSQELQIQTSIRIHKVTLYGLENGLETDIIDVKTGKTTQFDL